MQRKLTAIFDADVVGWSRLSQTDEAGTLERLKRHRTQILDPLMAEHGGRVVKLLGDGTLAEFPSVVAAVTCSLAIQDAMSRTEQDLDHDQRIRFRIGVNLGDVMIEGDDIYGEGVNVAARLQTLASPEGVCVSKTVRDHIEHKMACIFEDLGEHVVKNHETPIHAFAVRGAQPSRTADHKVDDPRKLSICVLPFANMSGDVEQEYFSDGISEDIITDLSKVSALDVSARNTSFQFKGKSVDIPQIARQLKVSHVLEGSVRKAGGKVRITAQLIDGISGNHVWAERYDRDLNDIFALQDEISEAIVKALKLKLLPEEKKAIERRGTNSVEAYNLYLMARQYAVEGNIGDRRGTEAIIRLCGRAIEIDAGYAGAWALMARGQMDQRYRFGGTSDGGLAAADKAIMLDANLADAHAVKARVLFEDGHAEQAAAEIALALRLDPEAWEVNDQAAILSFRQQRLEDAARYFEKATALAETDFSSPAMLITCYTALGNTDAVRRAAKIAVERAEKAIAQDRSNGAALSYGAVALAVLGQAERAKEWIARALLVDPENMNMRYNFACTLAAYLKNADAALDMLGPVLEKMAAGYLSHVKVDPDLDSLRNHPRYKAMIAAAEARLAAEGGAST
jgi:adenylate cyclase